MLQSSHMYYDAKNHFAEHGVTAEGVGLDLGKMMAQKDKSVEGLTKGIEGLFKKNKARAGSSSSLATQTHMQPTSGCMWRSISSSSRRFASLLTPGFAMYLAKRLDQQRRQASCVRACR